MSGLSIGFRQLKEILAFAPFTSYVEKNTNSLLESYAVLPASKFEIESLKGKILIDDSATKNNFLKFAQQ